jgi:hypothetical protein
MKIKKLNNLVLLLIISSIMSSCSYMIYRNGYNVYTPRNIDSCQFSLVKYRNFNDSLVTRIGRFDIAASPYTIKCTESDAISLIIEEGCYINADFGNIVVEDMASESFNGCYTCIVDFYKIKDKSRYYIQSDTTFFNENVQRRVKTENKKMKKEFYFGMGFLLTIFTLMTLTR